MNTYLLFKSIHLIAVISWMAGLLYLPRIFVYHSEAVQNNKSEDSIHVTNIDGPLKHLENNWFFRQDGDSSEVEFHVDFELKNKILNVLMIKSFDLGLKKIADAFEKRAIQLFEKT